MYVSAALSKIKGDDWINGDALFIILQNPQYYSSTYSNYFLMFPNLLKIGTYFTIFISIIISFNNNTEIQFFGCRSGFLFI